MTHALDELTARYTALVARYRLLIEFALIAIAALYVFWDGLAEMAGHWSSAEYSYAYLIPVIALWMIFRRFDSLAQLQPRGSWFGVAIVTVGLLIAKIGDLSSTYSIIQYAFLLVIAGIAIAAVGWRGSRLLLPALVYLVFMVPLPLFFRVQLTAELQLLSTHIGVLFLRALSIPVFVEGNVIDLGSYKLQVAEACSGLRYLFPLLSFGFLVAYLYRGPVWQRALLLVSTIPITLLMNGFRIGIVGISVDHWGIEAAQGFLHLFEGWVVFLLCLIILLLEAFILARFSIPNGRLTDLLRVDFSLPSRSTIRAALRSERAITPLTVCAILFIATALSTAAMPRRMEMVPDHKPLDLFPSQLGGWRSHLVALEPDALDLLKLDDYLDADYVSGSGQMVNLYIAYYASQRKGAAIHSPHNCLPGGGWQVERATVIPLNIRGPKGQNIQVNRVVIHKGLERMLVYYWFQERGRIITQEYAAKWYVFVDSMLKHRTDGALVRLVTPIQDGEINADVRLTSFVSRIKQPLDSFIPN